MGKLLEYLNDPWHMVAIYERLIKTPLRTSKGFQGASFLAVENFSSITPRRKFRYSIPSWSLCSIILCKSEVERSYSQLPELFVFIGERVNLQNLSDFLSVFVHLQVSAYCKMPSYLSPWKTVQRVIFSAPIHLSERLSAENFQTTHSTDSWVSHSPILSASWPILW